MWFRVRFSVQSSAVRAAFWGVYSGSAEKKREQRELAAGIQASHSVDVEAPGEGRGASAETGEKLKKKKKTHKIDLQRGSCNNKTVCQLDPPKVLKKSTLFNLPLES